MLRHALLQMCTAGKPGYEYLYDFGFVKSISCTYIDPATLAVVALMVWGGVSLALYLTQGDIRIPVVLLLLTGGVVMPQVAAPGLTLAVLALLLTAASLTTVLYYKYSR